MPEDRPNAPEIRRQNDAFRRADLVYSDDVGRKFQTAGIGGLPSDVVADIWRQVVTFDVFTSDNDPHGEHDFGAFDYPGVGKIFWKIDYYDEGYEFAAENPASSSARRVLTVMLAEEY